ncbi:MAG: hypothetical protein Kow0059_12500 [Candidatus Sumerlaeia bacterium]
MQDDCELNLNGECIVDNSVCDRPPQMSRRDCFMRRVARRELKESAGHGAVPAVTTPIGTEDDDSPSRREEINRSREKLGLPPLP